MSSRTVWTAHDQSLFADCQLTNQLLMLPIIIIPHWRRPNSGGLMVNWSDGVIVYHAIFDNLQLPLISLIIWHRLLLSTTQITDQSGSVSLMFLGQRTRFHHFLHWQKAVRTVRINCLCARWMFYETGNIKGLVLLSITCKFVSNFQCPKRTWI